MVSIGEFFKGWVSDDFKSRNFSIYGQWIGVLAMILCFATGISNLFVLAVLGWAIVAIVIGACILFLEVPILFKCIRAPDWFEKGIRMINGNWQRALAYIAACVPLFASAAFKATSLIATAIILLFAGLCFILAFFNGQEYASSKALGGGGMANVVV